MTRVYQTHGTFCTAVFKKLIPFPLHTHDTAHQIEERNTAVIRSVNHIHKAKFCFVKVNVIDDIMC